MIFHNNANVLSHRIQSTDSAFCATGKIGQKSLFADTNKYNALALNEFAAAHTEYEEYL